ncbi:L-rhamnose isomerase [Escherichia coli]
MHCWQGDDVSGFENPVFADRGDSKDGNYPGKARNASELRTDLEQAMRLIPGPKRLYLIHARSIWNQIRQSRAIRSNQSTSKTGLNGRKPISSVWILTPPAFRIR